MNRYVQFVEILNSPMLIATENLSFFTHKSWVELSTIWQGICSYINLSNKGNQRNKLEMYSGKFI